MEQSQKDEKPSQKSILGKLKNIPQDYLALYIGIAVSLLLTLVIWLLTPNLAKFEDTFLDDQGAAWYFWKLPDRNTWIMLSVWFLYAIHQILIWATIYLAQKHKTKMDHRLKKLNYLSFAINGFFILLHLIHTQLFYDKLAQDVPIWTSQGSVILMLSIIVVMENPRRGTFFGKKMKFKPQVIRFIRKYHGYYISWALIYTFWFHPSVGHLAHIWGFFYMFLLLLQGSLMYTKAHLNKYWTVALESFVALHGALVAVMQAQMKGEGLVNSMWPMFFMGFMGMVIICYIYGLNLPKWVIYTISGAFILFIIWLYVPFGYGRDVTKLFTMEFLWIPIILFGIALLFGFGGNLIVKWRTPPKSAETSESTPAKV